VARVVRPLAVDRTLIKAWAFVPEDAPELLAERASSYVRLVFSPMSIVAHDDIHVWESIQRSLAHDANPWVSLHRGWKAPEVDDAGPAEVSGTDERLMRAQHRAWLGWMQAVDPGVAA
jgi:hypothetical protein